MGLKLQEVPASAGWSWVSAALGEYARHAFGYTALFVGFMIGVFLTMLLPWIGDVLFLMSVPLLSLGFMMGAHNALHGRPLQLAVYLLPWRQREPDRRAPLLTLLLAYAVVTAAALWFSEWVDGGAFDAWLTAFAKGDTAPDEVARLAVAPGALAGALWRIGLTAIVAVPFWFAPALVFWGGQSAAQALFSSTVALWRARGAFLTYAMAWVAVMMVSGMLATILVALLGPSVAGLLVMPLGLVLSAVFYVSLFFSFRDCFGEP
jgi:hypothetical protein